MKYVDEDGEWEELNWKDRLFITVLLIIGSLLAWKIVDWCWGLVTKVI